MCEWKMKIILKGWTFCQQGLQWRVGTGQHIKFWDDPWIGINTTLRSLVTWPLPAQHHNANIQSYRNLNTDWNTFPFIINQSFLDLIHNIHVYIVHSGASQVMGILQSVLCIVLYSINSIPVHHATSNGSGNYRYHQKSGPSYGY